MTMMMTRPARRLMMTRRLRRLRRARRRLPLRARLTTMMMMTLRLRLPRRALMTTTATDLTSTIKSLALDVVLGYYAAYG